MADPKYENLPGIAYDQPDVYECGDLPEADQPEPGDDDDNECIEQLHLSVKDSFNKFKGKFVGDSVDFSDRLSKKTRTGYRVGEWTLAAAGEAESPQERYQRLRCEFAELLEQVTQRQSTAGDADKEELGGLAAQISSTKKALDELKLDEGETVDPKVQQLQELLAKSAGKRPAGGSALAELRLRAEPSLAQSARVARLEQRLHALEAAAGARDEDAFRRLQAATGEVRGRPTLSHRRELLARSAGKRPAGGSALAELRLRAEPSLAQSARVARLEQRLHALEAAAGARDEDAFRRLQAATGEVRGRPTLSHRRELLARSAGKRPAGGSALAELRLRAEPSLAQSARVARLEQRLHALEAAAGARDEDAFRRLQAATGEVRGRPTLSHRRELLARSAGKRPAGGSALAELRLRAEPSLAQSARVARLEQRLHALEAAAGARDEDAFRRLQAATGEVRGRPTLSHRRELLARSAGKRPAGGSALAELRLRAEPSLAQSARFARLEQRLHALEAAAGARDEDAFRRLQAATGEVRGRPTLSHRRELLARSAGKRPAGGSALAELRLRAEPSLAQSARVARLEQRLHALEAAAGARDEDAFRRLQAATGEVRGRPTLSHRRELLARSAGKRPAGGSALAELRLRAEPNLAQSARFARLEQRLHALEAAAGARDEDAFRRLQAATGEVRGRPTLSHRRELLARSAGKRPAGGSALAELRLRAEPSLAQSARVARLEQRLHALEAAAGARDEDAFRRLQAATGEATICGAAAALAARAALLRPAELAAAEARVGSLLANMDAIKAAVSPADPERDAKINELYNMLKQIEGISHTEILERMEALESLHNQASNFGKSLSELEALQSSISSGVHNNKALLQGVQEVFAHNVESIQREIKKLDERISKLAA